MGYVWVLYVQNPTLGNWADCKLDVLGSGTCVGNLHLEGFVFSVEFLDADYFPDERLFGEGLLVRVQGTWPNCRVVCDWHHVHLGR